MAAARRLRHLLLLGTAVGLAGLLACATAPSSAPPAPLDAPREVATATATAAAPATSDEIVLQVFALSDFHGWLLPLEAKGYPRSFGGIAQIAGMLTHKEKLDPARALILDNGDMWTGPTESTLLRGESVIQAYNALGLTAANLANHEFDFGQEILRARASEARFPFLGANVVKAGTQETPEFLKRWILLEKSGVKVAVIGLSFLDTPKTTLAKHVAGLEFKPYAETLQAVVPEAKAAGAEVIVLLFHDELGRVKTVLEGLPDLGLTAVVAGQNHRREKETVHGTPIVNPGPFGRSYARFDITFDTRARRVVKVTDEVVEVSSQIGAPAYPPTPELVAIAEAARQKAKALSDQLLGRLARPLPVGTFDSTPLGNFIVDSWLSAIPEADFAILNHGALRQPLAAGDVKVGDLLGVLPFENNLYLVELTAAQIAEELTISTPVVGGLSFSYRVRDGKRTVASVVDRVGKPLDAQKRYRVVILDFMYTGGDGFTFQQKDPSPVDTGLSCREPMMRALRAAEATSRKLEPLTGARARLLP